MRARSNPRRRYDSTRRVLTAVLGRHPSRRKELLVAQLAERLKAEGELGVTATALHPATLMPTKLVFEAVGRTVDSLEQGIAATLRLVIDPQLDGVSGVYYEGIEEATADAQAYDPHARLRLWELSERLCGMR